MARAVPGPAGSEAGIRKEAALIGRRPAAVLFDMDGTLVDSEGFYTVALTELAAEYGGRLSAAARLATVGIGTLDSMTILHADIGQPWRDPATSAARLEDRVMELFAAGLPWRPGAQALVRAVRAEGIPTALVTSTVRRLVTVALATLGPENFDAVVCGDDVAATKPDPTPYLTAARLLGVPAAACVAVEDSPAGVASARAAGVPVVAVPQHVPVPPADGVHRVTSLAGVDLALLTEIPAILRVSGDNPGVAT
jgi:HAD superfamily hydrolase (TIGR01509 family)